MKRFVTAALLVGALSFLGFSMVSAHGNYGNGPGKGYGNCDGWGYCSNWSVDEQDNDKMASFMDATKETRRQIAVKKSERRALMNQDNPDEKRVAQLTGEIYDLKISMDDKAKEAFGSNHPLRFKRALGGFGNCSGRGPRNL